MRPTCLPASLFLASLLCSTAVKVLPVHLTVSPSRSQFFRGESVTLTCEDENISDGWTVRRNTSRGTRTQCEGWGKLDGLMCNISYLFPHDSGVYWCESMSGSSSSSSSIQLSVSEEPSIPSTQTPLAAQTSCSLLLVVLLPLISLFVLVMLVFLGWRLCSKSRGQKELITDDSLTCSDVTSGHQENERRKESDSAAVYSTVRRQDKTGEIFIKHKSDITENDVIYSAVRTETISCGPIIRENRNREPHLIYSSLRKPAEGNSSERKTEFC